MPDGFIVVIYDQLTIISIVNKKCPFIIFFK